MKVSTKDGKILANATLAGAKDTGISANLSIPNLPQYKSKATVRLQKAADGLNAHVALPKGSGLDIIVTAEDIKAVIKGIDGETLRFLVKLLMKG